LPPKRPVLRRLYGEKERGRNHRQTVIGRPSRVGHSEKKLRESVMCTCHSGKDKPKGETDSDKRGGDKKTKLGANEGP